MNFENNKFLKNNINAQKRILARLASINLAKSESILQEMKFKGTLMSLMELKSLDGGLRFQVVSSAPHSIFIEKGVKPHWVHKEQLNGWMESKGRQGNWLFVAKPGTKLNLGLKYMELGMNEALNKANAVVKAEISKI